MAVSVIEDSDLGKNAMCLTVFNIEDMSRCLHPLNNELEYVFSSINISIDQRRQSINRMAAGSLRCMYSIMNSLSCNDATKKVMYLFARLILPAIVKISDLNVTETTTSDFRSMLRCSVGVYGDPHLRLCRQARLTTCSAPGEQTYISNAFFSVTAKNVALGRNAGHRATSVRSITITFKSMSDSTIVGTYSGDDGRLPEVFDNTSGSTIGQGEDKVTLVLHGYKRRTFIQHSTGMVLFLRQWSGNYFFTLRASERLIQSSFGLLSTGCPTAETIDLGLFVRSGKPVRRRREAVSVEQCGMACNQTTDASEFQESCIFDCYVTEDVTFAVNMTAEADEDVTEIITRDDKLRAEAITISTKKSSAVRKCQLNQVLSSVLVLMGLYLRY